MALNLYICIDGQAPQHDQTYNGATLTTLKAHLIGHYYPNPPPLPNSLVLSWIQINPAPDLHHVTIETLAAENLPPAFIPANEIAIYCTRLQDNNDARALYITKESINFFMQLSISLALLIFSLIQVAGGSTTTIAIFLPIVTSIVGYWLPSPAQQTQTRANTA
jgi:hypothetical protein